MCFLTISFIFFSGQVSNQPLFDDLPQNVGFCPPSMGRAWTLQASCVRAGACWLSPPLTPPSAACMRPSCPQLGLEAREAGVLAKRPHHLRRKSWRDSGKEECLAGNRSEGPKPLLTVGGHPTVPTIYTQGPVVCWANHIHPAVPALGLPSEPLQPSNT